MLSIVALTLFSDCSTKPHYEVVVNTQPDSVQRGDGGGVNDPHPLRVVSEMPDGRGGWSGFGRSGTWGYLTCDEIRADWDAIPDTRLMAFGGHGYDYNMLHGDDCFAGYPDTMPGWSTLCPPPATNPRQEDLDAAPYAHNTNTPGTWKAGTYTDSNRENGLETTPTVCPVKCHYNGTPGRHMTVIFDRHALAQKADGGWKCGLEVSTGNSCECVCEGTERSVTVTRSCFEEWSQSEQNHILHHQDGNGYHFLPSGQGFAGDNPLCSHDDAAGDGLRVKHTINADLSGSTGPGAGS